MRVCFGGRWIADSEHVVLLHEPGRYPVAYFPQDSITARWNLVSIGLATPTSG
jgi:uncharacterized protein (DUF427 family)